MGKLDFDVDQMVEVVESKNTINDKAQQTAAQSAQTSVVMPETGARSKTSAKPQEGSANMHRSSNIPFYVHSWFTHRDCTGFSRQCKLVVRPRADEEVD